MQQNKKIILGLIVEFNPYHRGHQYYVEKAKQKIRPDTTIAITTTSFSMRGEIAISDKFQKTRIMLMQGIDLVVELPFPLAVQSADYFAYNSVNILSKLGVTDLAFGIESESLEQLFQLFEITNAPTFQAVLKVELKKYASYKVAFSEALNSLQVDQKLIQLFNQPNATLAFQYLQAIKKSNLEINIHGIERMGSHYHNLTMHSSFASAKAIRFALQNQQDVSSQLPLAQEVYRFINQKEAENKLFSLLQYQLLVRDNDFTGLFGFQEGIENYIRQKITLAQSYEELLNILKNKRYSISRFQRLFTYLLLALPKKIDFNLTYLRVLGFTEKGESYLRQLPEEIKTQIITSFKNCQHPYANLELKATKLFGLLTAQPNLYMMEFQIPIKGKDLLCLKSYEAN